MKMDGNSSQCHRFVKLSLPVKVSTLVLSALLLFANCIGHYLLLSFYNYEEKKQNFRKKTASLTILRGISCVSLVGSFIGLLVTIIITANDFQPLLFCALAKLLQHDLLFLTFSLTLHFVSCITIDRFCTITDTKYKITKENVKKLFAIVTAYVSISWLVIFVESIVRIFVSSPIPACDWCYSSFIDRNNNVVTISIVSVWMFTCNTIICNTTLLTVRSLRKASKEQEMALGREIRQFETKRLTVAVTLSVVFSAVWIPYGIVAGQKQNMDLETYAISMLYLNIISYSSFLVLPIVYFFMDKRFEQHIRRYFRSNVVASAAN